MIHKFSVRGVADPADRSMAVLRASLRLPDLRLWHDYYIEFERAPEPAEIAAVAAALGDGDVGTRVVVDEPLDPRTMVQVTHRRGVVDNESESIVAMCALLDLPARAGKVATTYQSADPRLAEIIAATRCNRAVEDLHTTEPAYQTLVPVGGYAPAERFDLLAMDDDELAALGRADGRNLSLEQMRQIRDIQRATGGAPVTDVLLEALDARWSDHCLHTHLALAQWRFARPAGRRGEGDRQPQHRQYVPRQRRRLGLLPRSRVGDQGGDPQLDRPRSRRTSVSSPSSAGCCGTSSAPAWAPTDRLLRVHRDRPAGRAGADQGTAIAAADSSGHHPCDQGVREHVRRTDDAVADGVPPGVPGEAVRARRRHRPNTAGPGRARRPRPGDMVVLIGGRTGNEGIHGASASSAGATMAEAAVQIGAPLEQVKFRKAIIDLRDAGCLRAVTDLGAAGLTARWVRWARRVASG